MPLEVLCQHPNRRFQSAGTAEGRKHFLGRPSLSEGSVSAVLSSGQLLSRSREALQSSSPTLPRVQAGMQPCQQPGMADIHWMPGDGTLSWLRSNMRQAGLS